MTLIEALEKIEQAPLGNARLETLAKYGMPSQDLKKLLNYAMDPATTFGLRQIPDPIPSQCISSVTDNEWWTELQDILDALAKRELTGSAAKTRVGSFLSLCGDLQQKWAERIIKQDLRLSIGSKDVNKVLGKGTIAQFEPPLAKPFKDLKSLDGQWYLQTKFDGGRCIAVLPRKGGEVRLMSRTWKEWGPAFKSVKAAMQEWNNNLNSNETWYVDGELVIFKNGRMDFNACQKMFHVVDDRPLTGKLEFCVFDMATEKEYLNPKMAYSDRLLGLCDKYHRLENDCGKSDIIKLVQFELLHNPKQEYLDKKAVEFVERLGCDGAIIRRADVAPRNKKTTDITKVKPFEDGEAEVVQKVEGTGWLVGSLGALVCRLKSGVEFHMGTGEGLTKELRQELWDDPNLIGSQVSFKYQRLSDEDKKPILPTFRGVRHPDDIGN